MRGEASALYLNKITKTYGSGPRAVHALRGVDLRVEPGRLAMLVGPSGSGKTTLLSIISGLLKPSGGEVEIFGRSWSEWGQKGSGSGTMVGMVFQKFYLIPTISILDNVAVALFVRGVRRRDAEMRAKRALEEVGLGGRLCALPRELSGGMQQRVALRGRLWASRDCWSATSRQLTSIPRPGTRSWS